jgi:hypothetical protein
MRARLVAKHSMGLSEKFLISETARARVYQKAVESGKLVCNDGQVKYKD